MSLFGSVPLLHPPPPPATPDSRQSNEASACLLVNAADTVDSFLLHPGTAIEMQVPLGLDGAIIGGRCVTGSPIFGEQKVPFAWKRLLAEARGSLASTASSLSGVGGGSLGAMLRALTSPKEECPFYVACLQSNCLEIPIRVTSSVATRLFHRPPAKSHNAPLQASLNGVPTKWGAALLPFAHQRLRI